MKTLLLMRHAKSDWNSGCEADIDRPLNHRGKEDAPRMGKMLRRLDLQPDSVLCSPSVRTRETAQRLFEAAQFDPNLKIVDEIYEASYYTLLTALQNHGAGETLMMIGHNPGTQQLIHSLCGGQVSVPTAAMACFDIPVSSWNDLAPNVAMLRWYAVPKMIKAL